VDANEFYRSAVEGLRHFSLDNHAEALKKVNRAHSIYTGSYLPGIPGKINTDTRNELKSLYLTAVKDTMLLIHSSRGHKRTENRTPCHGRSSTAAFLQQHLDSP
jgi:hypothetical protein